MTSALITNLGGVHTLRVISHRAVSPNYMLEGTRKPSQVIGRALLADALVEGSVQRSAETFRIDVRLVDALTGKQLWAQRFQDAVEHRFAVQDSITRSVLAALNVSMTADEGRRIRTPPTTNMQAYDLFLRGRIRIRKETRADDSIAVGFFQQAVALDPTFALAHAWLGSALGERVRQFAPGDSTALEQASLEVEKAVRLDPELAEAHYAKATLLWGTTNIFAHEQAVREDQRALALDPNLEAAHHHLGMIYAHIGLLDEAVEELQKTLALDPNEWLALLRLGNARFLQGRRDEALRIMRQVPSTTNPSLWTYHFGRELIATGKMSEAAALIDEYLQQHPGDPGGVVTSLRAILSAKRGDARAAEADIQLAQVKGKGFIHFHHAEYNIATAYALLHQPDLALAWLKRAAAEGWPCYPLFASDPDLDAIRKQPAFVAFLAEQRSQWERFRQLARSG